MIGMVLIAEGFGAHVPKGYIYTAMAFSAAVEGLNMFSRKAAMKKQAAADARLAALNKADQSTQARVASSTCSACRQGPWRRMSSVL